MNLEPCWFHRFGGGEPCDRPGRWRWPDPPHVSGRQVLIAMRWCDEHKHSTDVVDEAVTPDKETP